MSQSVAGARNALFASLPGIFAGVQDGRGAPVLVSYGKPGSYQSDYIVALMNTRRPITRPTMGTARTRHTDAEFDLIVSCYVPGAEVVQQIATDAHDSLVDLLEAYFRVNPNEKLGGACMEAWVSNVDGPVPDTTADPGSKAITGRVAYSTVTVTARIRY